MEGLVSLPAELPWLMTALDLVGVFFFATSGALLASRKGFDLVGSIFLSLLAGLGGGVTRDVLLDRGVPASLENPVYLIPPVLVAILVYVKVIAPHRMNLTITIFDAGGLALFTVTGTRIALEHGVNPVAAVVIGTLGALGGGLLRDIVANEVPTLFDPRGVYATPTVVGAVLATVIGTQWELNVLTGVPIAVVVFTLRMVAYRYRWRLPGADISMDQDSLARLREAAAQAQSMSGRRLIKPVRPRRRYQRGTPRRDPDDYPSQESAEHEYRVEGYDPETEAVTVVDTTSGHVARLDPATGIMDVIDPRTGWTKSYDDPNYEH